MAAMAAWGLEGVRGWLGLDCGGGERRESERGARGGAGEGAEWVIFIYPFSPNISKYVTLLTPFIVYVSKDPAAKWRYTL